MSIQTLSFHELLNHHFVIPPYQRGYRWDNNQVNDLLNDLKEFIDSTRNGVNTTFYCLQPIVVVPNGGNLFTVIDGQQRLTTIYLLLNYLKQFRLANYAIFELEMPARPQQQAFIDAGDFADAANQNAKNNIDTFYIRAAYQTIESWFNRPENQFLRFDILRLLTDPTLANNARIIWYEITNQSAPEAFRRLNYGKIPLTSTELVKALILQGGHIANTAPYRRAIEWDNMEHALNNPALWGMLAESSSATGSHLELVIDFVADELNAQMSAPDQNGKLQEPFKRKSEATLKSETEPRDYFNYHVVNEYINRGVKSGKKREEVLEDIWTRIRNTFNLITNWFDNRNWFHFIGLIRILQDPKNKKSRREFVSEIHQMAHTTAGPKQQTDFTESLREKIGSMIKLGGQTTLKSLRYKDNNREIIKILEVLNVHEALESRDSSSRFSFSEFEDYNVTSLEHIHPQNITTDQTFDDFTKWFNNRVAAKNSFTDDDWRAIVTSGKTEEKSPEKQAELIAELKSKIEDTEIEIRKLIPDNKTYLQNSDALTTLVAVFDQIFGDLSGISEDQLHSISNMALVDKDTNSALQNFFLDRKRGILSQRHNNVDNVTGKALTYVPIATFKAFAKEWTQSEPGDMRLWRQADRDAYFKAIEKAYDYFTKIQTK